MSCQPTLHPRETTVGPKGGLTLLELAFQRLLNPGLHLGAFFHFGGFLEGGAGTRIPKAAEGAGGDATDNFTLVLFESTGNRADSALVANTAQDVAAMPPLQFVGTWVVNRFGGG